MSFRVRSLSTLYSPLLEGTPRRRVRDPWPLIAAVLALCAALLAAHHARGASCPGGRCEAQP